MMDGDFRDNVYDDGSVDAPFDASRLAVLTQALIDAGLSDAQIAKVMGGNMIRYLAQNL